MCHYAFVCDLSERILPTLSSVSIHDIGVFQDRSTASSLCVGISPPPLTVHVAIPVRNADGKIHVPLNKTDRQIFIVR